MNCLDRHIEAGNGNKAAIIFEGEPGDVTTLTYRQLHREVCLMANVLKRHGVKLGDRVMIYLPMIPEAVIAMLACARLGAPHSVVFSGYSAEALKERINDCGAKVVITSDGGFRRGSPLAIKPNVDQALLGAPKVKSVIVVQRTKQETKMAPGRDYWLHGRDAAGQRRLPRRSPRQRAPALHPLHQRQHGQTEGHSPHHGGAICSAAT